MSDKARVIASVVVGDPPSEIRTLTQWLQWRAREDARIEAELLAQLQAQAERDAGVTEH